MENQFPPSKRAAGILMHITSLHSDFGIGDLGPEARNFVSFLRNSGQKYWQILPITFVQEAEGFSPYSSGSSIAGNTLLISPEVLLEQGLVSLRDVKQCKLRNRGKADYKTAARFKEILFEKAFRTFQEKPQHDFEQFVHHEDYWLNDFALFRIIKEEFRLKPWYEWPDDLKMRDQKSLLAMRDKKIQEIRKVKWLQFIFYQQWASLRRYCRESDIKIVGDLPFYVNYDSADVWANRQIFKLGNNGEAEGVAGVPPDYFNSNGQLWGMPVYRWNVLEGEGFEWWINRIRKNLELFDVLRLDHFRAFADYWEVRGGEKTAINGEWKRGPGAKLFHKLKSGFSALPLIAEDLGDINKDVINLRDEFQLPGMKVLQFAFGNNMPESEHIPHNYSENFFAYTGTHDNNTSRGWYSKEAGKDERERIEKYAGCSVGSKNVHKVLTRLVYASAAKTVIIPMQDILGLGAEARMNTPASTHENWLWRIQPSQLKQEHSRMLRELVTFYGRNY